MLLPCNQISPTSPSGSSCPVSGLTITAHRLRATWPHDTCGTAFGESGATRTAWPVLSSSRSKYPTDGCAPGLMVATSSVASAMPYDGLNAVRGNPQGANALLNVLI